MPGFSTFLANKIINTDLRSPATPHVTVSTAEVTDDGAGGGTISAARPVTFGAPSNGSASNTAPVEFTSMTAGNYGFVQVWSNATRTNLLYSGQLLQARAVAAGDSARFDTGEIVVTNV